jgi:hypothetical protein
LKDTTNKQEVKLHEMVGLYLISFGCHWLY